MDISLTARHTTVPPRFRQHLEEKLAKLATFGQRLSRVDVCVDHEPNPRQSGRSERIEVTLRDGSLVVRAEASAQDLYAALDIVQERLAERLRRARDKSKPHRGRARTAGLIPHPAAAPDDVSTLPPGESAAASPHEPAGHADDDYSPVAIRRKQHGAEPMSVDEALSAMELVGHDFYLFEDAATGRPAVVYRRKGWSYGVIELVRQDAAAGDHTSWEATAPGRSAHTAIV